MRVLTASFSVRALPNLSQVPDASAVEFFIGGSWVPAVSVIGDSGWLNLSPSTPHGGAVLEGEVSGLAEAVRGRGAAVLAARKLSSAMSAANAIAGHLSDWLAPAPISGRKCMEKGCGELGPAWTKMVEIHLTVNPKPDDRMGIFSEYSMKT